MDENIIVVDKVVEDLVPVEGLDSNVPPGLAHLLPQASVGRQLLGVIKEGLAIGRGAMNPFNPCSTIIAGPEAFATTTGRPEAMASAIVTPKVSVWPGKM